MMVQSQIGGLGIRPSTLHVHISYSNAARLIRDGWNKALTVATPTRPKPSSAADSPLSGMGRWSGTDAIDNPWAKAWSSLVLT
jgi:hypothetical protein